MIWFEQHYEIDGELVTLSGSFVDSQIRIIASIDGKVLKQLYHKPVNMWIHQEILAEDIFNKYQGMIRKSEKQLPILVEKFKINERI